MDAVPTLEEIYPPFGVRITLGDLTLREIRDEDLPEVTQLALDGLHGPEDVVPFPIPWHLGDPASVSRRMSQYYWTTRAAFSPERWRLTFLVRRSGEAVGVQDLFTRDDFRKTRTAETGSWLSLRFHRQGIGTLMRQAVCSFAFDHLGAEEVTSGYIEGNESSAAVSRKVGYLPNGVQRHEREEGWASLHRLSLTSATFVRPAEPLVAQGVEPLRRALGLASEA